MDLKEYFIRQHFDKIYNAACNGYDVERCVLPLKPEYTMPINWSMTVDKKALYDSSVLFLNLVTDENNYKGYSKKFKVIKEWACDFLKIACLSDFKSVWDDNKIRILFQSAEQFIHVIFNYFFDNDLDKFYKRINYWNDNVIINYNENGSNHKQTFLVELDFIRDRRNSFCHFAHEFYGPGRDKIIDELCYQFYDYIIFFYTLYLNADKINAKNWIKKKISANRNTIQDQIEVKIQIENGNGLLKDLKLYNENDALIKCDRQEKKCLTFKLTRFGKYTIKDGQNNECEFTVDAYFTDPTTIILWKPTIKSQDKLNISKIIYGDPAKLPANIKHLLEAINSADNIDEGMKEALRSLLIFALTQSPREEAQVNQAIEKVTESLKADGTNVQDVNSSVSDSINRLKNSIAEDFSSEAILKLCEMIDARYNEHIRDIDESAISESYRMSSAKQADYEKFIELLNVYKNNPEHGVEWLNVQLKKLKRQEAEAYALVEIESVRRLLINLNYTDAIPGLFAEFNSDSRVGFPLTNRVLAMYYIRQLRNIFHNDLPEDTLLFLKLNPGLVSKILDWLCELYDGSNTDSIKQCREHIRLIDSFVGDIIKDKVAPGYTANFSPDDNSKAVAAFGTYADKIKGLCNQIIAYHVASDADLRALDEKQIFDIHFRLIDLLKNSHYFLETVCLKKAFFRDAAHILYTSKTKDKIETLLDSLEYEGNAAYDTFFASHIKDRNIEITTNDVDRSQMVDKLYEVLMGKLSDEDKQCVYLKRALNIRSISKIEKLKIIQAYLDNTCDVDRICAIIDELDSIDQSHSVHTEDFFIDFTRYTIDAMDSGFGVPDWSLSSKTVFDRLPNSDILRKRYILRLMWLCKADSVRFEKAFDMCLKYNGKHIELCYLTASDVQPFLILALRRAPTLKFVDIYNMILHSECRLINAWCELVIDNQELLQEFIDGVINPVSVKCLDFIKDHVKYVESKDDIMIFCGLSLSVFSSFEKTVKSYTKLLKGNGVMYRGSRKFVEIESKLFKKLMSYGLQQSSEDLYRSIYKAIIGANSLTDDVKIQRINALYEIMPIAEYKYRYLRDLCYYGGKLYIDKQKGSLTDIIDTLRSWLQDSDLLSWCDEGKKFTNHKENQNNDAASNDCQLTLDKTKYMIDSYTTVLDVLRYLKKKYKNEEQSAGYNQI